MKLPIEPAIGQHDLNHLLVKYDDLRPCTTAFIDTRTPGSALKENFTIIGPGVSENPDQHVHIRLPHGFNIGAARQPPGCVNSQHSHETAEVFVVHQGKWAFRWGIDAEDGEIILTEGDTISIPTGVFRGFENVGNSIGFLYAVLGGDDPGRVTWAPYVFDMAKEYGLTLLENGLLIDSQKGEEVPPGAKIQAATTLEEAKQHRSLTDAQMRDCVCSQSEVIYESASYNDTEGVKEGVIIGPQSYDEKLPPGKMSWLHGFSLRRVELAPGAQIPRHARIEEEVIFVHQGQLLLSMSDGEIQLQKGDTFTVPKALQRTWNNTDSGTLIVYVVRGGDVAHPPFFAEKLGHGTDT